MNETVRQRLKRRVLLAFGGVSAVLVPWWLAMQFVVHPPGWLQSRYAALPPGQSTTLALWCLLPVVVSGAWLYGMTRVRCPRCGKGFRYQFVLRVGLSRKGSAPQECPSCGLSLDDRAPR